MVYSNTECVKHPDTWLHMLVCQIYFDNYITERLKTPLFK